MKTQINKRLELFFRLLLLFAGVLLLTALIILIITDYDSFTGFIIEKLKLGEKAVKFKAFVTPDRFRTIKIIAGLLVIFYSFVAVLLWKKANSLIIMLIWFCDTTILYLLEIKSSFNTLSVFYKALSFLLFAVIIGERIYFAFIYPFTYDEIFSYLVFVDKGFLVTATYYPGPNNHIFFSILCNLVDLVSDNPILIMRVPAFLAGLMCSLFVFVFFLRKKSIEFSLIITALLSFSYNVFYYSIHGRGYIFILLFFIISLFCLLMVLEVNGDKKKYFTCLYIFASIFGFYSIPIFLYPFCSMQLVLLLESILRKDKALLRILILSSMTVVAGSGILYLPVIAGSGLSNLIGNKWTTLHIENQNYTDYFIEVCNHLWNVEMGGVIITFLNLLPALFIMLRRKEVWFYIFLFSLILPLVVVPVQKVHPFARVWDYLIFLFAVAATFIIHAGLDLVKRPSIKTLFAILVVCVFVGYGYSQVIEVTRKKFPYYTTLNAYVNEMIGEEIHSVYVPEENYRIYFQYYSELRKKDISVLSEYSNSEPDLIILPENQLFPEQFKRNLYIYSDSNPYIDTYRKK